ncbi:hypothetical protein C2E23DRAFT_453285 [Lenzites betulinus]|nr:hypothetical protein C2E23DRAFT_453285 [Lenzites betulinus]
MVAHRHVLDISCSRCWTRPRETAALPGQKACLKDAHSLFSSIISFPTTSLRHWK